MREITGRHVLFGMVGAFGVIVAVNLALAWNAVATFPGLEVRNSYVASQSFDRDRKAQQALGWTVAQDYRDGILTLTFTDRAGLPAEVERLSVLVGRATEAKDDTRPAFVRAAGRFEAPLALAPGRWMLRIEAEAPDGTRFVQRRDLTVRAP